MKLGIVVSRTDDNTLTARSVVDCQPSLYGEGQTVNLAVANLITGHRDVLKITNGTTITVRVERRPPGLGY